jgi:hypothetical protein
MDIWLVITLSWIDGTLVDLASGGGVHGQDLSSSSNE